jgi:hypothetical protein
MIRRRSSSILSLADGGAEPLQYMMVHAQSYFEVQLYHDTVWMSATSDDLFPR